MSDKNKIKGKMNTNRRKTYQFFFFFVHKVLNKNVSFSTVNVVT